MMAAFVKFGSRSTTVAMMIGNTPVIARNQKRWEMDTIPQRHSIEA